MTSLDEILTIFGCIALVIFVTNCVFHFLTPKDLRPDDFDPWDMK